MNKTIYAKLHDILKLTDEQKKHFCPEWDANFVNIKPELKIFLKHHCVTWYWTPAHKPGCSPFGIDAEMFCIHLADVKAATISRKLRTAKYQSFKTFRIWRDIRDFGTNAENVDTALFIVPDILKKLNESKNLDDFYVQFEEQWDYRAEDKKRCPFASLGTHNQLTAAWFELFLNNQKHFGIPEVIHDKTELQKARYSFTKKKIAIVRMRLKVNTKLSRLRDAKLIKDTPNILNEIAKILDGVAIYTLPEEILIVTLPDAVASIQEKVAYTLGYRTNYYIETSVVETILSNKAKAFLHNYNLIFGEFQKNLYPKLEEEIPVETDNEASHRAIICDMCQMAPAMTIYPQQIYNNEEEIEPVEEFLCKGCLEVRESPDRAKNLATWEDEKDAGVAFFKITLEMNELVELLKKMFVETFNFKKVIEDDLGFSIIDEFIKDYERLLIAFQKAVFQHEEYGEPDNHEIILDNLFCIKTRRVGNVGPLVNEYVNLISSNEFFVQMVNFSARHKMKLPIKLSVTMSNIKHPFMEHWQTLNNPKDDLNIFMIPHTNLVISITRYITLRDSGIENKKVSVALHNLAKIEERTKNRFLVTVAMLDMKNDLKKLAKSLITTSKLTIEETLAYYKITKSNSLKGRGQEHD